MQRESVTIAHGASCGRTHVAAAMLLGCPRAARLRLPIHANDVVQELPPNRIGSMRPKNVSDGTGQGDWTVQADVGLREDVAHGEGQQVRRAF
jgi:hypothetical protein